MAITKMKTGDVVRLKIGGPKMTVETCTEDGTRVACVWFHWQQADSSWGGVMRDSFPAEILEACD